MALFACLGAASICGQYPRSFPGRTQDTRGSRSIQPAQTPLWLGGEQEFQLFQAVTKATLRDSIGPRASYFLTRNAACCRSASPLYAWLKWSFIPNWPRNYNLVNKFSGVESVSLLRATVRDRVSRGCATVGHHAGHAGTGVPHPHCEACVNAQLRLWPVLLPVPLPHGCGAVLRVSDAGSRFPGYQFRLI